MDEGFPAEQISERLAADPDVAVWLDLHNPTEADLQIVVDEFGLHPLAVEDAIHPHQRPKVDRYRSHLFANMYAVAVSEESVLTTGEISVFITPRALITVRKDEFDIDVLITNWDLNAGLVSGGNQVAVLAYGLLDAVVDGHHAAVQQLDDAIEDLQDCLFEPRPGTDIRRRGYELSVRLARLRRVVAPMQDVVARLVRSDSQLVDEALGPRLHRELPRHHLPRRRRLVRPAAQRLALKRDATRRLTRTARSARPSGPSGARRPSRGCRRRPPAPRRPGGPPEERIHTTIRAALTTWENHRHLFGGMLVARQRSEAVRRLWDEYRESFIGPLAEMIDTERAAGIAAAGPDSRALVTVLLEPPPRAWPPGSRRLPAGRLR